MVDGGKWTCEWKLRQENSGRVKKISGEMILYTTTSATKIANPSITDSPIIEDDGFKLTTFGSNPTFVHTGNDIILSCKVSSVYKTCVFKHDDKTCKLELGKEKGECKNFPADKIIPIKHNKYCDIYLRYISLEDEGVWLCDVKADNIPSQNVKGNISLKIIPDSKVSFLITIVEEDEIEEGAFDFSKSKMFTVITVILPVIVVTGFILMFLFWYKRKVSKQKLSTKLERLQKTKDSPLNENNYVPSELNNEEIYEDIDENYESKFDPPSKVPPISYMG